MPKRNDAKLLQVLRRQGRQNRLINVVLAKQRLILSRSQAPQPDHNVHDKRPIVVIMIPSLRENSSLDALHSNWPARRGDRSRPSFVFQVRDEGLASHCQVGDQKDQEAPAPACERRARTPALTTLVPWRSLPREGLWVSASFALRVLLTSELPSPTTAAWPETGPACAVETAPSFAAAVFTANIRFEVCGRQR